MLLKRQFDPASLGGPNPVCTHVSVKHTGSSLDQNFSSRLVAQAMAEGWMSLSGGQLTVKADPEDLRYDVLRGPGYYCVHDGKEIPVSNLARDERLRTGMGRLAAAEAKAYLKANGFEGVTSPNPAHPSGYEVIDHFECVLDSEQHAKFKVGAV